MVVWILTALSGDNFLNILGVFTNEEKATKKKEYFLRNFIKYRKYYDFSIMKKEVK